MKKLYLAKITMVSTYYMVAEKDQEDITRLVWADSPREAGDLLEAGLNIEDPYGTSQRIEGLELSEAFGEP